MVFQTPVKGLFAGFLGAAFTFAFTSAGVETVAAIALAGGLTGLVGLSVHLVQSAVTPDATS